MTKIRSLPCFTATPLTSLLRENRRALLSRRNAHSHAPSQRRPAIVASASAPAQRHGAGASRIVCVGDVHGKWDAGDERALRMLEPDLVLFVGDYGNEDVRVTRRIADLAAASAFGVATVFGNHDAFFTATAMGRSRAPYDKSTTCRVTQQKEMLADFDVSYRSLPFDDVGVSVVGGRSWSWGGPHWKHKAFYREFEGVSGLDHSSRKIIAAVADAKHDVLLFLSHSGPFGLGDKAWDPCGRDWGAKPGGDYGDQDLRDAIEFARANGVRVPLVVFGHMHKTLLKGQGSRTMLVTEKDGDTGLETVMLNTAVVPRHRSDPRFCRTIHNFHVVEFANGSVRSVDEVWVAPDGTRSYTSALYSRDAVTADVAVA